MQYAIFDVKCGGERDEARREKTTREWLKVERIRDERED